MRGGSHKLNFEWLAIMKTASCSRNILHLAKLGRIHATAATTYDTGGSGTPVVEYDLNRL